MFSSKKASVVRRPKACFTYWKTDSNLGISYLTFRKLEDGPFKCFVHYYTNAFEVDDAKIVFWYYTDRVVRIMRAVPRSCNLILNRATSVEVRNESNQSNIYIETTEVSGEFRLLAFPAHPMDILFLSQKITSLELAQNFKHFSAGNFARDLSLVDEKICYAMDKTLSGANLQTINCHINTFQVNMKVILETKVKKLHFVVDRLNIKGFHFLNVNTTVEELGFDLSVELFNKNHWFFQSFIKSFPSVTSINLHLEMEENFGHNKVSKWESVMKFPERYPDIAFFFETGNIEILQCCDDLEKLDVEDPNYDYYRHENINITFKRGNLALPFMQGAPLE
ncbi:unnamed protein product [Bursaphelenchus xylophilus]|uniref:(pine wood nematode) hypothetical protein n=1 Tax=Bursaphelenchus xylophilus TaxID=6326 RepID=A0A1I7RMT6_BURXY|nr:unnamed protein product [Bursaphelenchus xylophilus]CAG9125485.1 unnamed protein product [Bursaphelenchus xylophilus]